MDKLEKPGIDLSLVTELFLNSLSPRLLRKYSTRIKNVVPSFVEFAHTRKIWENKVRGRFVEFLDAVDTQVVAIDIITTDKPFILESILEVFSYKGLEVKLLVHPIVTVLRDEKGNIVDLGKGIPEAWIHVEVVFDERNSLALLELVEEIKDLLFEVELVVSDWKPMTKVTCEVANKLQERDYQEESYFLNWLVDNHFTFLGIAKYKEDRDGNLVALDSPVLGVCKKEEYLNVDLTKFGTGIVTVAKSSKKSRVHRPVHMDTILVNVDKGIYLRILGLFTSQVYSTSVFSIPLLRKKAKAVIERSGFKSSTHDYKTLLHILETLPRDELFQLDQDDLYILATSVLDVRVYRKPALFVRQDKVGKYLSALVFIPRDKYSARLRASIGKLLEKEFGGEVRAFYLRVEDSPLAQIHYILKLKKVLPVDEEDVRRVTNLIVEQARTWEERLTSLIKKELPKSYKHYVDRLNKIFPLAYQEHYSVDVAIYDLLVIDEMFCKNLDLSARFIVGDTTLSNTFNLKIYSRERIVLSEIMPILERMGLIVKNEDSFVIDLEESKVVYIHDFLVELAFKPYKGLKQLEKVFEDAIREIRKGTLEIGTLNRLILACGFDWWEVTLFRCFSRYLKQSRFAFSQRYMANILSQYPESTVKLKELFYLLFDPIEREGVRSKAALVLSELRSLLKKITSADAERVLSQFMHLIRATVRTNFFLPQARDKKYVVIKLRSKRLANILPSPIPEYEFFVYSPDFEGVHMRAGKVARGGIRWSDRVEDYRTEILGLFKAQVVKNALIVPVGAKGGFIVKGSCKGENILDKGKRCYQLFIEGMLSVTDNIVGSKIVPPEGVVRRDGDDFYLVVAADKGTAKFSDFANEVASRLNFWLGDAFASGGSAGYDHKKMGITAKSAWEAVKRHFRELGINPEKEIIRVVGIGDMSGDVFGNGMLLSKTIKLIGAFDHRDIFIDPDPDPESSYNERKRLFNLPVSSWQDYRREVLSKGGMIFSRSLKQVELTSEAQKLLRLTRRNVSPDEVIRALLTLPVDLIWFGGIGTFVKASSERNQDVGDRSNDAIRVDASELRCKVIGEGANLGVTQRGRVEFALRGGKINMDAIDNLGGVDCSDKEVNIKIPLMKAIEKGKLSMEERNILLKDMEKEVTELVLRDSYLQTESISVASYRAPRIFKDQVELLRNLVKKGLLDKELYGFPEDEELSKREATNTFFTRPELAVLLCYAKIDLYKSLLSSQVVNLEERVEDLVFYFPTKLQERFREEILEHNLREEIIATTIVNSVINRMGPSFVYKLTKISNRDPGEIVYVYLTVRDAFELRSLWEEIESLDWKIPAKSQYMMLAIVCESLEALSSWILREFVSPLDLSAVFTLLNNAYLFFNGDIGKFLSPRMKKTFRKEVRILAQRAKTIKLLARKVISCRYYLDLAYVARIAEKGNIELPKAAQFYFTTAERLSLDLLFSLSGTKVFSHKWDSEASEIIMHRLRSLHEQVNITLITRSKSVRNVTSIVETHFGKVDTFVDEINELVKVAMNSQVVSPVLSIIEDRMEKLLASL